MTGEQDDLPLAFPLLQTLRPFLQGWQWPVYLVGGAVRDALLDQSSYDLDFVVPSDANRLAFAVADHLGVAAYTLDKERDMGRVVFPEGTMLDFARYRGEDLRADLQARDFTINAMALPALDPRLPNLIDPCQGRRDLHAGVIRLAYDEAIGDDPVRGLRAVRLSVQFDFPLTLETAQAVRVAAMEVRASSPERIRDELVKMLRGPGPHRALRQMADLALLEAVLPETAALRQVHDRSAFESALGVLSRLVQVEELLQAGADAAPPALKDVKAMLQPYQVALQKHLQRPVDGGLDGRTLLRFGALFQEVGKVYGPTEGADRVARRLDRLRLSNEAVNHVRTVVAARSEAQQLAEVDGVTRRAVYRYYQANGRAGVDIGLVALARHLAVYPGTGPDQSWRRLRVTLSSLYEHYFHKYEETVAPRPLLGGDELMAALELKPGPQIGRLLGAIKEAQAAGEVANREQALTLARRLLDAEM